MILFDVVVPKEFLSIGDRVVITADISNEPKYIGMTGTIVVAKGDPYYKILWGIQMDLTNTQFSQGWGHYLDFSISKAYGRWESEQCLEII